MFQGNEGLRRLMSQETIKPYSTRETLTRFGGFFKPYWYSLVFVTIFVIISTWAQVTSPDLIGQVVDCYLTPSTSSNFSAFSGAESTGDTPTSNCWLQAGNEPQGITQKIMFTLVTAGGQPAPSGDITAMDLETRISGIGRLILIIIGLYVLSAVLTGSTFFSMAWAGQHVLRGLRVKVFNHLHRLSVGFHTENEAGDLMSRITNDMETIQQAINFALINVLGGFLLLVWIAYNMIARSMPLALLSLVSVPAMLTATLWFSSQARKAYRKTRQEMGSVNAELQENIAAVREVQAFNRADENIENFKAVNAANRDANIRAVAYTSALAPTLEALGYVSLVVVVGVGGLAMLRGNEFFGTAISLGLLITFLGYVQRFNQPIQQISILWTNLQSAIAGGERVFGLLDEIPEVQEKAGGQLMPTIKGKVTFENVSASYKPDEPVLKSISFQAEVGQTIAIVGPTGAGKTTIINLIPRFYDPTSGRVLIDGVDVSTVVLDSLRKQIGIVLQDTFLFSTSVMENIRFGRPSATDEEVIAAAKLAHADTFIERLPDKYSTVLGERGSGLSQGQRQLLAIARAALANPRILILDEATSSVDTRTETLIQTALDDLLKNRTSFVIAHRLSTIRNADVLLVLDKGEIVERGTHNELLAKKGFYYNLYTSQFWREPAELPANGQLKTALAAE